MRLSNRISQPPRSRYGHPQSSSLKVSHFPLVYQKLSSPIHPSYSVVKESTLYCGEMMTRWEGVYPLFLSPPLPPGFSWTLGLRLGKQIIEIGLGRPVCRGAGRGSFSIIFHLCWKPGASGGSTSPTRLGIIFTRDNIF